MEVTPLYTPSWQDRFVAGLDAAIVFNSSYDEPNDTSQAVILALSEVKTAFVKSQQRESGWKS